MTFLYNSPIFLKLGIIMGFWSVAVVFLLISTDIIPYTLLTVPYVVSFIILRRLLMQLQLALQFSINFTSQNISIFYLTNYFCTFFMIMTGLVILVHLISTIFF